MPMCKNLPIKSNRRAANWLAVMQRVFCIKILAAQYFPYYVPVGIMSNFGAKVPDSIDSKAHPPLYDSSL